MPLHCGSSCQKNGRARRQARGCRASAGRDGLSERRACSIIEADRKMIRYCSRRAPDGYAIRRTVDVTPTEGRITLHYITLHYITLRCADLWSPVASSV